MYAGCTCIFAHAQTYHVTAPETNSNLQNSFFMYECVLICTHINARMYICLYIYLFVYIFVYV